MSVVDIHPEELLDREAKGAALAPEEQAMLRSHLERCAACRLQRLARADFAREIADGEKAARLSSMVALALRTAAPPAQPLPASQLTVGASSLAGASRSLDISSGNHPAPELVLPSAPAKARGARARLVVALSFAAVMVAGVAAAGFSGAIRVGAPEPKAPEAPQAAAPAQTASPRKAGPRQPALQAAAEPGGDDGSSEPSASAAPAPADGPPSPAASSTAPSSAPVREAPSPRSAEPSRDASAPRGEARSASPDGEKPAAEPRAAARDEAASLFSSASDARAKGDEREASRLYQELVRRFPQSREAQVARAVLGRMALDRGDGAQALENFDGYLKSGDATLGEEAMVGRARTLERLGKRDEEARAWAALLQSFPQSPHAAHARARLEALQKR